MKKATRFQQKKTSFRKRKKELVWFTFLLPTFLCLLVLTYIPTMKAVNFSFHEVSVVGEIQRSVGVLNYKVLLSSSGFRKSIGNTIVLSLMALLAVPFGFVLACGINGVKNTKAQTVFRLGFYMPNIITGVCIVLIFQYILQVDNGLINLVLSILLGRKIEIGWLSDPSLTKVGASIIQVWTTLGYNMLICLAGLQAIPSELYEAAMMDGASSLHRWRYITIPLMRNSFIFLFITGIINGFSRFTDLYILSGNSSSGKPAGSLQSILMYIYQYSFENPSYGMACAGAVILFLIVFTVTSINLKVTKTI
ncbi:MAG: sugar ABC transporter permease [Lachnospiraceae bacterium]|jgi:ABC-type sugar transport system permease subunit|nr:sugar ABC transporter permease [Lachnospiraceae bacterium]